jgi:arylsulfatase
MPAGRTSDEIVHVVDWFTTILRAAGLDPPGDREIDGVDQLGWLTGAAESSAREGYIYWMGPQMYGVKWRNFKLVLIAQMQEQDAPARLATPRLINLTTDPQEREPVALPHLHTWAATHFNRIIGAFEQSTSREPPIPAGAPLGHVPARS